MKTILSTALATVGALVLLMWLLGALGFGHFVLYFGAKPVDLVARQAPESPSP